VRAGSKGCGVGVEVKCVSKKTANFCSGRLDSGAAGSMGSRLGQFFELI
jgi:hypothetical protein